MLVAVIAASSAEEAWKQFSQVGGCAGVELRLDFWSALDYGALKALRQKSSIPLIFTLRDARNGGQYTGSESERLIALTKIAELCQDTRRVSDLRLISSPASKLNCLSNAISPSLDMASYPDFVDFEHTVADSFLSQLKKQFPLVNIVRSYHNFKSTPENLDKLLDDLIHPAVAVYKLVTMASTVLDGLRMLNFVQKRHDAISLVGLCLGEVGQFTRVLSPIVGGAWEYVSVDERMSLVPGQLSLQTLQTVYNYDRLNKNTAIYGLIGDPVAHSVGPLFHNDQFKRLGYNAVYVKFKCTSGEVGEFFNLIKTLNIKGLSVTMPLKSSLPDFVEYVDDVTQSLRIVNTLNFKNGHVQAFNTDAPGALAAIRKHMTVKNKKILIIGAGSTAKAITVALSNAGSHVKIINRTEKNAAMMVHGMQGVAPSLSLLMREKLKAREHQFDLVINTIPSYPESQDFISEIVTHSLSSTTVAMDCTYNPEETLFLAAAKKMGSPLIFGKELFREQAIRQLSVWGVGERMLCASHIMPSWIPAQGLEKK